MEDRENGPPRPNRDGMFRRPLDPVDMDMSDENAPAPGVQLRDRHEQPRATVPRAPLTEQPIGNDKSKVGGLKLYVEEPMDGIQAQPPLSVNTGGAPRPPLAYPNTMAPVSVVPPLSAPHPRRLADDYKSSYQKEPEMDPEDPYRPEGTLYLTIDHFSDFCKGQPEHQQRLSRSIFVRGVPWKILAIPRCIPERTQRMVTPKALGFFLQCNGDGDQGSWSCIAHATLKVKSRKPGMEDHARRISHTFYPKENDWGYSQFMSVDQLANPDVGYNTNDSISLEVHVAADAPHGVMWDSKKHTGFIGLKNQGATCYMNSILQTFYFTNQLRKAVYQMPTADDEAESSVALALQRVFYDLQHADKPVGTKKLTKSFGWDSLDSFLQHDVQELCRVLLDNLETKMKGTQVTDTIPSLFKGRMKSYIKCTDVDFESSHEEVFYDVQLNVRPKDQRRFEGGRCFNVLDSFRDYIEAERMDGDNKYDAGQYGLQPALKGVSFLSLPPVLHLQLMRFQFDPSLENNVKVNERFEFTDVLDLNEFVEDKSPGEDYTYILHAVLVHSGDFHGGHYVVFINTEPKGNVSRWCKFDDDVVSRSTFRDAVAGNFGGDDAEVLGRTFTNAYMLVYVRKNAMHEVLAPVMEEDIPQHLRERFEGEKTEEAKKKKEKMEAHLFLDIHFLTNDILAKYHGFDLFDNKLLEHPSVHEKIEKAMTVAHFFDYVSRRVFGEEDRSPDEMEVDNHRLPCREFRLWMFAENAIRDESGNGTSLPRPRASVQIFLNEDTARKRCDDHLESDRAIIFIETAEPGPDGQRILCDYNDKADMLMFLKYYDAEHKQLVYCGHTMLNYRQCLDSTVETCNERAGLPKGTKLRFYEEVAPDRIRPIESLSMPLCSEYMLCEVNDGGVLIFERIDETTMTDNVRTFLEDKFNRLEVELIQNEELSLRWPPNDDGTVTLPPFPDEPAKMPVPVPIDPEDKIIKGVIHLNWSCLRLCSYIGDTVGWDAQRILLWKYTQMGGEKPTVPVTEGNLKTMSCRIKDVAGITNDQPHDPRKNRKYRIFYNRLTVTLLELEKRRHLKITAVDDRFNLYEINLFPERNGTVRDILDEAKKVFKFSARGTGVLRLVYASVSPHNRRVFTIFNNDDTVVNVAQKMTTPLIYAARVEEVPFDQLQFASGEILLPVTHFDKTPSERTFGVPFFFKVREGETLKSIRDRIQERLAVPEKEYEKYKFALVQGSRVLRYLEMDSDERVRVSDLTVNAQPKFAHNQHSPPIAPVIQLGIDHYNRNHRSRGPNAEKAIVIHN